MKTFTEKVVSFSDDPISDLFKIQRKEDEDLKLKHSKELKKLMEELDLLKKKHDLETKILAKNIQ